MSDVTYQAVLREFFRRAALAESQTALAARLGIPRQNVGAILSGAEGREVMPQHVTAYAVSVGQPISEIMFQLARIATVLETTEAALAEDDAGPIYTDEPTARARRKPGGRRR